MYWFNIYWTTEFWWLSSPETETLFVAEYVNLWESSLNNITATMFNWLYVDWVDYSGTIMSIADWIWFSEDEKNNVWLLSSEMISLTDNKNIVFLLTFSDSLWLSESQKNDISLSVYEYVNGSENNKTSITSFLSDTLSAIDDNKTITAFIGYDSLWLADWLLPFQCAITLSDNIDLDEYSLSWKLLLKLYKPKMFDINVIKPRTYKQND